MKEAREGRVEWPDLDVNTFVRFAEFAYASDYTEPKPEVLVPEPSEHTNKPLIAEDTEKPDGSQNTQGRSNAGDEAENPAVIPDDSSSSDSTSDGEDGGDSEDSTDSDGSMDGEDGEESEESENGPPLNDSSFEPRILPGDWVSGSLVPGAFDPDRILRDNLNYLSSEDPIFHRPRAPKVIEIEDFEEKPLPYCVYNYMQEWKEWVGIKRHNWELLVDQYEGMRRKRRRLGEVFPESDSILKNNKYDAMLRFEEVLLSLEVCEDPHLWRPSTSTGSHVSYRLVLLCHARLYILADKYGVEELRRLALCRLYRTLLAYDVHLERVSDLVTLAMEVYNNTVERDPARSLVSGFLGCFIEDIRDCPDMREAIRRGGDFAEDMVYEMSLRLS